MRSRTAGSLTALAAGALALAGAARAVAAEPEAIGFEQAIERAVSRNPSARSAQQEIERAIGLLRQGRSTALPNVNAGATYTRLDDARTNPANGQILQHKESVAANVTLSVPLFAPGRWAQWSYASENVDVARASAADVRRLVALTTARAWLTALAQHRVVDANDRAARTAQAHLDYARGRRAGGVGTRLDEVRADQEVQATSGSLESARTALARAREALGVLLGAEGPVDVTGEAEFQRVPTVDEALQEAGAERADLKALRARRTAAQRIADYAWLDYLPTLTAQGQPFYQDPATTAQPKSGWTAQLILSLPIFDGGLRWGQSHERAAIAEQAGLQLEAGARQAGAEIRAGAEALQRADAALASTQNSARLAHEALDLATEAYRAGATTNLEVIDAERRALDADTSVAIAEDAARQARLELLAASGRFPGPAAR